MKSNLGRRIKTSASLRSLTVSAIVLSLFTTAGCGGGGSSGGSNQGLTSSQVTGVSPAIGTAFGGTLVTITGSGFAEDIIGLNTVRFGGREATSVTTVDDTTLTCMSPEGTGGLSVSVEVRNNKGTGRLISAYSYLTPPPISSDLNDDGIADVAVGAPRESSMLTNSGAVYVFMGSDRPVDLQSRDASAADLKLVGMEERSNFGVRLATGDVNGDGIDDLIAGSDLSDIASIDAGAVYIFLGPLSAGASIPSTLAEIVITGAEAGERLGSSVCLGDLNDDGVKDVIIGASRRDAGGSLIDAGAAYVFYGGAGLSSASTSTANLVITGEQAGSRLGNAVDSGDLNADGIDDLILASSHNDPILPPRKADGGSVYVIFGGSTISSGSAGDADAIINGSVVRDEFGHSMAVGDMNQDGTKDLMVGVPKHDTLGSNVGRVYVFLGGPAFASMNAAAADVFIEGQPANNAFGGDLSCGDTNGDGMDDLVIGASEASFQSVGNGRTYVFHGGADFSGSVATSADVIYTGEAITGERFGACAKVVDINRDGLQDVMSSAPGNDAGGSGAGRVYLFRGEQFMQDRFAEQDDTTYTGEDQGNQFGSAMINGQ